MMMRAVSSCHEYIGTSDPCADRPRANHGGVSLKGPKSKVAGLDFGGVLSDHPRNAVLRISLVYH